MKRVSSAEARTHFYQLVREVKETGCRIVIQRRGKDMAVLVPHQEVETTADEDEARRGVDGLREAGTDSTEEGRKR